MEHPVGIAGVTPTIFRFFGQFYEGMAENILIKLRLVFSSFDNTFAGFFIEESRRMPNGCRSFCRSISFSFDCFDVQQFGTFHVFYVVEHSDELGQVVAVDRTKIADIEAFKEVLLATKQRFDAIVETENKVFLFSSMRFFV